MKIIYYHEIVEDGKGYSYQKIDQSKFEDQMKWIRDNGYISLFFSELDKELPKKSVIVSFDDGFKSVYQNAIPIMQKYGIKGNVYLSTAYIGTDNRFMDWDMVIEMQKNRQLEMQAHTHTHIDIRLADEDKMREEIEISNHEIEKHLEYQPIAFCIPYGKYNRKSIKILKDVSNYKYILGSFYGDINMSVSAKILPRIGISNEDNLKTFERKMKGLLNWKGYLQRLRLFYYNIKHESITKPL